MANKPKKNRRNLKILKAGGFWSLEALPGGIIYCSKYG
jgi:hypothetical protein